MADTPLLAVRGLRAGYGAGDVLHGIDLEIASGTLVALLGANGAGKSTLLQTIAGLVPASGGSVELRGQRIDRAGAEERARCGVYLVPERRAVFPNLTVSDNLRLATAAPERSWRTERDAVLERFPRLAERRHQAAGTLSGGEQQMLALARAFAASPVLLLLDEPSLGLAPMVVDTVFRLVEQLVADGVTVLLVEQYVERAVALAARVSILQQGRVVWSGLSADVDQEVLATGYLNT
jgi:branched-chain amino acid transport system ATP-binding protein